MSTIVLVCRDGILLRDLACQDVLIKVMRERCLLFLCEDWVVRSSADLARRVEYEDSAPTRKHGGAWDDPKIWKRCLAVARCRLSGARCIDPCCL